MRTKDINTLSQLRAAKTELKFQMKQIDRRAKNNFLFSTINKWFSGNKKNQESFSLVLDAGTKNAIRFLASQSKKKIVSGKILKPALLVTLAVGAPLLAWKTVKLVKSKI